MSNENWVTINGVHVLIGANGKITKGPAKFIGSKVEDLPGSKATGKYASKSKTTSTKTATTKKEVAKKKEVPKKTASTTVSKNIAPNPNRANQEKALDLAIKRAESKYGSKTKEADVRREFKSLTGQSIASDMRVYSKKTTAKKTTSTPRTRTSKEIVWNTRFSSNGSQVSSDGKYQINKINTGYGEAYELIQYSKGRAKRVGVYSSMQSAKNTAKH